MSSTSNLYASLDELKREVGIASGTTTYDLGLELALNGVCRVIDDYTGRRFYGATGIRYYTADNGSCLLVDDLLAVETIRTDDDGNGSYETEWSATCFHLSPDNAAAFGEPYWQIDISNNSSVGFPTGVRRGVQINGNWGYSSAAPADVKLATLRQAALDYRAREAPLGRAGGPEFEEPMSPGMGGLHPHTKRSLDHYRVPTVR